MDDETKAPSSLPGNQGQPQTDGATESHKPQANQDAGDGTPAADLVPHEAESSEANPGVHQEQAGMRS